MADQSYRFTVLQRLTALLQATIGVLDAAGNPVDMGDKVFRGRMNFGDSDPLPCVSIIEATRPEHGFSAGTNDEVRAGRWPLIIQGWVKNDPVNPTDPAYGLAAAIEQQLGRVIATDRQGEPLYPDDYMLGPGDDARDRLIVKLGFGQGVVSPPREQVSTNAFFFLPVWVELAEKIGQPYIAV